MHTHTHALTNSHTHALTPMHSHTLTLSGALFYKQAMKEFQNFFTPPKNLSTYDIYSDMFSLVGEGVEGSDAWIL